MKQIIAFIIIVVVCAFCGEQQAPALEGRYVYYAVDQFGQTWDTLVLKPVNHQAANTYRLVKISGILRRKLDDTVWLPLQREEQAPTTVTFDPKAGTLKDEETGVVYSVDNRSGAINDGTTTYVKMNESKNK